MSKIEVNTVAPQCGTTLTLGESGDTVTLGAGASQSGFGRTGTVDWQTSIKTSTFTAVNGEGYFVNTSGGAVTVNLPAGSAGAIVSIKDYAQTFNTNNCTISANGSEKIENLTADLILDTLGIAVTLIYADATRGWQAVNSNEVTNSIKFVAATGGTIATCGDFKIHTFTGPGTFCVSCKGTSSGSNTVSYMVVAGGGGGGLKRGGGGGAGGFREGKTPCTPYTASPLVAPAGLPVSAQGYPITVGGGGTGGVGATPICNAASTPNANGSNSIFSTITSAGGGLGAGTGSIPGPGGGPGGSGGAGFLGAPGNPSPGANAAGSGNTPSVSPPQGNNGGAGFEPFSPGQAGGGGGAGVVGNPYNSGGSPGSTDGKGGNGVATSISGSPVTRAGGGGGGGRPTAYQGQAGSGGGGRGSNNASAPWGCNQNGENGTTNTGGGGGGSGDVNAAQGGAGGSGVVIIRYKFQ
jgi:hypothetical protein